MACTITHHRKGCLANYCGYVNFDEHLRVVQHIHFQNNYDTIQYVIDDLSAVTTLDLSQLNLHILMSHELGARYTKPSIRTAIVSTDPGLKTLVKAFNAKTKLNMEFFRRCKRL